MDRVSVVVPVYNAARTLEKCIRSILKQSFRGLELILVDDGSTDKSLAICKKYRARDERIVVISQPNAGSIASRRRGVEAARSDYVVFVDADDWIDRDMIRILYEEAVKNDLDLVVCNTYKVLGWARERNNSWYFNEDKLYYKEEIRKKLAAAYLWGHPFPATLHGKIYRKRIVVENGSFLSKIKFFGDDLYYNLEILLHAERLKVIHTPLYYYRVGGLTCRYMPHFFEDMITGYEIQKTVVERYYPDTKEKEYDGICIMLLNLLRSSLYNLFVGRLDKVQIKQLIFRYLTHENVRECLYNKGCLKYFPRDYLEAIYKQDTEYMYRLGKRLYLRRLPHKLMIELCSFL
ncbi:glycosyltransferase [Paenibacillus aurantius]|uniref:Glycosyltransferase n=1 Tax=Paenibacillus aurantius TaxID=2918900 RepID=A0AA96LJM4_9BACL|nr:glycosyltransferase [Paenibacillus aurantius]WNQ12692.1 glycosyltransferase [Paenibacillus aurantius]